MMKPYRIDLFPPSSPVDPRQGVRRRRVRHRPAGV